MHMRLAGLFALALLLASPSAEADPGRRDVPRGGLLAEIEFREGSARLPAASGSQLGQIAAWANDHFDALIVIDGHADARGPHAGNVRLSMRRARLVRDYLLALGVDPNQIMISAFGSEGRRHARVAVWGTDTSIESSIANKKAKSAQTKRHARPSPTRRR
jgi:hypothetical protein